jgi:DNA-binding response OmpR family regulator
MGGVVSAVQFLAQEEPEALRGEHGTILVVDDNDINREVLARRLERQGHTVALAASGREALDLVRAGKFDLVLLDVMMPEMNGYQVLQYMKADQALRDIPVIMISALDEIDSVVLCIEMGAEDYLPKPFNPVLLKARIDASLEKKRLRDQEIEYLQNAERVTAAAAAVEAGEFQPESLDEVAARSDALGGLARVFQRMAVEVRSREERLKQQVQELRIQVDATRKAREVAAIADTDYFRDLQARAQLLRAKNQTSG